MWDVPIEQVFKKLNSSPHGLSREEAEKRIEVFGRNVIEEKKPISSIALFLEQFKDPLVLVLIAAALISALLSYLEGKGEFLDAFLIIAIVIANAVFGFLQEYKAERTMEMLAKMAAPKARVLREGKETVIDSEFIVPGDVLLLKEGDRVGADARLFESFSLYADESSLTGESVPVEKDASALLRKDCALAERKNMVFSGTVITRGRGKAVVVATGMKTEIGKIAGEILEAPDGKTRFQEEMEAVAKKILHITIGVILLMFTVELFLQKSSFLEVFLAAVALGVAAIPEGLPAVITLALSIATNRMLAQNTLIRKLSTIQNLGSVDVICTDKTGTLTENRMTVVEIRTPFSVYSVSGRGWEKKGEITLKEGKKEDLSLLLTSAVLCNDAKEREGDPTEVALLYPAYKYGLDVKKLRSEWNREDEVPFSSERRMMSTLNVKGDEKFIFVKGAPETVLERCTYFYDGKPRRLSSKKKKEFLKDAEEMASHALRVIALAFRSAPSSKEEYEQNLVFLGFMGMIDPPRKGVKEALEECRRAGIRIIMITGDHPLTARAIGEQLGFGSHVVEGVLLDKMDDSELEETVENVDIFARTSPHHKSLILRALKRKGAVVCMTGDGVNDAPAIKNADVGIAMGIRGTEVTKQASDMVILDDSFISIKNAVKEGRGVFDNIRKFITLLLGANTSEVLLVLLASFSPFGLSPKIAIQLLWINLLTDGLPALALGADKPARDVMMRKPRKKDEGILSNEVLYFITTRALVQTLAVFALYISAPEPQKAYALFFTSLVVFELLGVYLVKARYNSPILSNKWVHIAVLLSLALQLFITYSDFSAMFGTLPLTFDDWIRVFMLGFFVVGGVFLLDFLGTNVLFKNVRLKE